MSDPLPELLRNSRRNRSKKSRAGSEASETCDGLSELSDQLVNDDHNFSEPASDLPAEPVRKVSRKVSRKMIVAYVHEDGLYCPRTINLHCQEHDGEDMNGISQGTTLDLNSIPGFPGVGGMTGMGMGGFPGLDGGRKA